MAKEAPATPAAEKLAEEADVDLSTVEPSGAGGKITVGDVKEAIEEIEEGEAEEYEESEIDPENPLAFNVDPEDFTYIRQPETPEAWARLTEILKAWEMAEQVWPLPLEWLTESLKAGVHLEHPTER